MARIPNQSDRAAEAAWENARATARENWPAIIAPLEDVLNLDVDPLPMLFGVRSDHEQSPDGKMRRAEPLKWRDVDREKYANQIRDAFESRVLDQDALFREALNEMVNSQEEDTLQKGPILIADSSTTWVFSEDSAQFRFAQADASSDRGLMSAAIGEIKEGLKVSHFLYIPGFIADSWWTFFVVGLRGLKHLRFRYAEMANVCREVRRRVAKCEYDEAAQAQQWGAQLEACAKELNIKEKDLAGEIFMYSASTFSNKKKGKGGRHFTLDQKQELVRHLSQASDGDNELWDRYPLLKKVKLLMAFPEEA